MSVNTKFQNFNAPKSVTSSAPFRRALLTYSCISTQEGAIGLD